jgi:hypothetical protein
MGSTPGVRKYTALFMACRHAIKYWKFRGHLWWGDCPSTGTDSSLTKKDGSPDVSPKSKHEKNIKPCPCLPAFTPEPQLADTLFRVSKFFSFVCSSYLCGRLGRPGFILRPFLSIFFVFRVFCYGMCSYQTQITPHNNSCQ